MKKSNGKLYWYSLGLDPLAESDLSGNLTEEYIFFGGKRIAQRTVSSGAVNYYFADHLGSSRIVTDAAGTVLDDSDFYPFGGERVISSSSGNTYKFTGKERDSESGLDFFIARYYSSQFGRFLSPDQFTGGPVDAFSSSDPLPPGPLPYAVISNPQSLNKYTYTWNNPLRYTDPDGHFLDTIVDAVSVGLGVAAVIADAITGSDQLKTDAKALAADLAGLVLPGVTGLGNAVRAGKTLDKTADAGKAAEKLSDASKLTDNADDASKLVAKSKNVRPNNVPLSERDPKRFFTKKEKQVLEERASGNCVDCGTKTV